LKGLEALAEFKKIEAALSSPLNIHATLKENENV